MEVKSCENCRWAAREIWHDHLLGKSEIIKGAPYACVLHQDDEHRRIAQENRYCESFECSE